MPYKDPDKARDCTRRWQKNNPARMKQLRRRHQAKRRDEFRAIIVRHKDRPCVDCGGTWPTRVMDLHHRDPLDKSFNPSQTSTYATVEALERELAKCDVVCANCHRLRHA